MGTTVRSILESKGHAVHTVGPAQPLADAVSELRRQRVGALVVTDEQGHVAGVLSERDVVRVLADRGPGCLEQRVADVMTAEVTTCGLDDTVDAVMSAMTAGRFRHLPVVDGDELVGIVSIGDAVKSRIDQLEVEREQLASYVTGSSY
jgi:CBS domain-containing protein